MKLAKLEERCRERQSAEESRRRKEAQRVKREEETVELSSSSNESSSDDREDEFSAVESSEPSLKRKRPRNVVTCELASALDRSKVSNRNATYVLAAAAQSLGHNTADIALNRESIRSARRKHRQQTAAEIRASFDPSVALTVHWDACMHACMLSYYPI